MAEHYVILDRDGVINYDSDDYIKSSEEWLPIPGSLEAIALLNKHQYKVTVISNQSGLSRGLYDEATLTDIHQKMHNLTQELGGNIESVYYCPHLPSDDCQCRKPKPGLLQTFAEEKQINLSHTYFIGDKYSDIQAALAAGALPMLVKTGKGEKTLNNHPEIKYPTFENLYDAANFIVSEK